MMEAAGFLTEHMVTHILAMNVGAPLAVIAWRLWRGGGTAPGCACWIGPAALVQMTLLWAWHLPAPMAFALGTPGGTMLMHGTLVLSALWFWRAVLEEAEEARWRALGALAITGKLFCLLGALLTFAPRVLYPRAAEIHMGGPVSAASLLPDQQLAGLLMLIACPLTYVLAGVVIAARWIRDIERRPPTYLPEESR